MKWTYIAILLISLFIVASLKASVLPYVTLAWDPHEDPDVQGYSLFIKNEQGEYDLLVDINENDLADPLNPQWTIQGLDPKEYQYFVATAFSATDESTFSNEACGRLSGDHYVDCGIVGVPAPDHGDVKKDDNRDKNRDKKSGSGGGGCFISATRT